MSPLPCLPYYEDQMLEELTDQLAFTMPMKIFLHIAAKMHQQEREFWLF